MAAQELTARFWSKVEPTGFCWLWSSALEYGGYPIYWIGDGVSRRAHRLAYEFLVGPIPDGMTLDHLCRVRRCVNPDHLEICSAGENARRSPLAPYNQKARWTHCLRGHEFTEENTAHNSAGRRECRTCRNDGARRRRTNNRRKR
jgi:hypothetical protein